jgi:hypothetical protein
LPADRSDDRAALFLSSDQRVARYSACRTFIHDHKGVEAMNLKPLLAAAAIVFSASALAQAPGAVKADREAVKADRAAVKADREKLRADREKRAADRETLRKDVNAGKAAKAAKAADK